MKVSVNLKLSDDCELASFHPEHALKYFIDQVSYPKLLSSYPIDPNRAVTGFVFQNGRRSLSKKGIKELQRRYLYDYEKEILKILSNQAKTEQSQLEEIARALLNKQKVETRSLLPQLLNEGYRLDITDYEN